VSTALGPIAVVLAVSYANLPVSACSHAQSRASAAAVHAAPRISIHIKGQTWLDARVGFHVGAAATWPGGDMRAACADASLDSPDEAVAYGVRMGEGEGAVLMSYPQLGWKGFGLVLGPELQVGLLVKPRALPIYAGGGLYLRHDQVFAAISEGTYRFRTGDGDSVALQEAQLPAMGGQTSMGRFQFGLRGQVSF
jgi:hypothetical protein